jgi:cytochrome c-type protein NapB
MKRFPVLSCAFAVAVCLLLPLGVRADEDEFEKDARYAEDNPPVVPHKIEAGASGESCLVCHLEGKNGAPLSPHAVRINCTQCHVQGEIKKKKAGKKAVGKKSGHHEE